MLSDPLSGSTSTVPVTVLPMDFESKPQSEKALYTCSLYVYWKKEAQTQKRRAGKIVCRERRSQRVERSFRGEKNTPTGEYRPAEEPKATISSVPFKTESSYERSNAGLMECGRVDELGSQLRHTGRINCPSSVDESRDLSSWRCLHVFDKRQCRGGFTIAISIG